MIISQGYVVRIAGGNDKQGFPMKQGVLTTGRVRLLLSKGHSCYRPRRSGERRRKSVRGCIVDSNLSVLSLVIIKKGKSAANRYFSNFNQFINQTSEKRHHLIPQSRCKLHNFLVRKQQIAAVNPPFCARLYKVSLECHPDVPCQLETRRIVYALATRSRCFPQSTS